MMYVLSTKYSYELTDEQLKYVVQNVKEVNENGWEDISI